MDKENTHLKKRIADLEEKVQNQQKEFGQALAFLFDRSEYKELIKQGKAEWPKMLTEALNNLRTAQEVPVQEQQLKLYEQDLREKRLIKIGLTIIFLLIVFISMYFGFKFCK